MNRFVFASFAQPKLSWLLSPPLIAPAAQRLCIAQVVVGTVDADGQQRDPEVRRARRPRRAARPCPCRRRPAERSIAEGRGRRRRSAGPAPRTSADIRVLSLNECQMSPYSATIRSVFFSPPPPISTGMSRVGCGIELGQPRLDARERGGQIVEPAADGAELVAVLVVVLLLPARPDAEDQPAVGDVVDGARHVGEQFGIAVGIAGHQRADLNARRLFGPRAAASSSIRNVDRRGRRIAGRSGPS